MGLSWIEIDKDNLFYNLAQFKKIAPDSEIWPVIKSNAYGHGLEQIAKLLDKDSNATGFMVVSLTEAIYLRSISNKPIMVLSFFEKNEKQLILATKNKISLPIYDLDTATYLDKLGKKIGQKFLVNVKVDTGTSRLGFRIEEAEGAIKTIKEKSNLQLNSIFTHYAESESEDLAFSQKQLAYFNNIIVNFPKIKYHSACSAAALAMKEARVDMVRLGIALYGLWPSDVSRSRALAQGIDIKPVMSFKTKIIQIKNLLSGESIGYNRTYITPKDTKLAVIPVGYYDGYSRLLSNKARVLIKGKEYNIRGNVCMNLSMVELPPSVNLKVGETVTLLGRDNDKEISAEYLARLSNTINYEVVTKLNSEIERIIV